jgi:hypothetical protein
MKKYVYAFGGGKADGDGKMKDVLGGKGAGLAEMSRAGVPVPPGFTFTRKSAAPTDSRWNPASARCGPKSIYSSIRCSLTHPTRISGAIGLRCFRVSLRNSRT